MTLAIETTNAATGPLGTSATAGASNMTGLRTARIPTFVPGDQIYYWSYAWQDAERKAMADLRDGRVRTFDDPVAAVHYLLGSDR